MAACAAAGKGESCSWRSSRIQAPSQLGLDQEQGGPVVDLEDVSLQAQPCLRAAYLVIAGENVHVHQERVLSDLNDRTSMDLIRRKAFSFPGEQCLQVIQCRERCAKERASSIFA